MALSKSSPDEYFIFWRQEDVWGESYVVKIIGYETNTHTSLLYFERSYWHGLAPCMENCFDFASHSSTNGNFDVDMKRRDERDEMRDLVV